MNEIAENTLNEELNKLFLVKIQFRENSSRLSTTWRSRIWNEEIQNTYYLESQRELESQEQQLLMGSQWADQAQRERIHLCSELEMKNRLHRDCYARSCQEIEELKRRCCEEETEVTQQRMNEFTTQHDQESRTAILLRDQFRRLQERLAFIEDSRIFQDPDSPSSSGSAHVPR